MRKIKNTIIIGILLAVCEFAGGQELEFRGSGLWSSAYTVFADSEYVYCGYQNGLLILRISELPGLEFVSRLFISDWGRAAAAYGDYAFFIDWELGLQSIDISNIEHPVTAQLIDSLEVPISLFIRNNYAYVGGDRGEFYIVDIQSPENMVVLSSTDISSRNIYTVCANDENAFLGLSYDLYVVDIYDPVSPVIVGDLNAQYDFDAIAIDDSYAYVAVLSNGMLIVDISNPANPGIISICDTPGYSRDVAVSGNYAYVADDYLGLQIIDISDPFNPEIVGDYDIPGVAVDIFYREGYVYLADDYLGIYMIDVTDPSNPLLVDQFKSHYYLHDLKVSGNYAYAATKGLGFAIADVSDITDPLLVSNWVIYLEHAFSVAVESPYAYVVFSDCMRIFDISDPYNPMVTGVAAWGGSSGDLVYSDDYLYAALGRYFALCYVHDRTNPLPRGWLYFDDTIHNLDVRENLAYVAGGSGGFL